MFDIDEIFRTPCLLSSPNWKNYTSLSKLSSDSWSRFMREMPIRHHEIQKRKTKKILDSPRWLCYVRHSHLIADAQEEAETHTNKLQAIRHTVKVASPCLLFTALAALSSHSCHMCKVRNKCSCGFNCPTKHAILKSVLVVAQYINSRYISF